MGRPGSDSHETIDANMWAAWGVDYLKEDSCGGTTHGTVWQQCVLLPSLHANAQSEGRTTLCGSSACCSHRCTQAQPEAQNFPARGF
jgi:hypothetical protein